MSVPQQQHIVVINLFFAPNSFGGATLVAEDVAKALAAEHGAQITAISGVERPDLAPYAVQRVEVAGITSYLINLPKNRSYVAMYDDPEVAAAVRRLLRVLVPDLVHVHCVQDLGAALLPMIKSLDLPLVLSVHDFWWQCERQFMIRPSQDYCGQDPIEIDRCAGCVTDIARARTRFHALQAAAAQADLITFPSAFAMGLAKRSGMTGGALTVWPNGVQTPGAGFFEAQAARRAANPTVPLVFGYLGGPSPIKGWGLVKKVFEALERDDVALVLVEGSLEGDWWPRQNLTRLRVPWAVHPRFDRAGMDDFYSKIDVLLFPSQWKETFGLTVREALSRGIHVIQTDSGGTVEWDGADPSQMMKIGDGAEELMARVVAMLDARPEAPAPMRFATPADQARHLTELMSQHLPAR